MADIFFSYARADAAPVQQLAEALAENGWTVWWDRSIPPGSSFDEVIEAELNAAHCVVVLWSKASITSSWVKEEAEEGLQRGVLTPVMIDEVRPPLGFRRVQAANLSSWGGDRSDPGYQQLLSAIHTLLDDASTARADELPMPTQAAPAAGETHLAPEAEPADVQVEQISPAAADAATGPQSVPSASPGAKGWQLPLWFSPVSALAVTLGLYVVLSAILEDDAGAVAERINALSRQPAIRYVETRPSPPPPPLEEGKYFVTTLAGEVASGMLQLQFSDSRAVLVLDADMLFQAGSDSIKDLSRPILVRIGQVLADWSHEPVQVSAHTDNVPFRTPRYPSNWHLSNERAVQVARILRQQLAPGADVRAEGRADTEPLADNTTRENRARNRRVEIRVPLQ